MIGEGWRRTKLVIGATTCDQSVAKSNWSISLSPIGHAEVVDKGLTQVAQSRRS